jgi:AcrR family transcriptional regulator
MKNYLTIREVAELLGISKSSIYRIIHSDPKFPVLNAGVTKKFICDELDLKKWLLERTIKEEVIKLPSYTIHIVRRQNHAKK